MQNSFLHYSITGLSFLFAYFSTACSKNNTVNNVPPVEQVWKIQGDSVSAVAMTTASFAGRVIASDRDVTDRGVYYGLTPNPTTNKTTASWYRSSGEFGADLNGLEPNTFYYVRGYAVNSRSTIYTPDFTFTTKSRPQADARITTDSMFAAGAYTIFVAGTAQPTNGSLKETGICFGENPNPSISDRKVVSAGLTDQSFFLRINGLKPATNYYIRSYAIGENGQTYYGNNVPVSTIERGAVSWKLNWEDPNADATTKAAYGRIKEAFNAAVEVCNNFTSIQKSLTVNYSPGTPTADGNISGWINMGANASYQKTGTALHEINHTVGVGTHAYWKTLIQNGSCTGYHTNRMLKFLTRDPSAVLKGDGVHFWPYGINGSWEDTGVEMDYIINCLLLQAMKKDGLPSY